MVRFVTTPTQSSPNLKMDNEIPYSRMMANYAFSFAVRQFPFQFGPSLCFKARLSETIDIKIIFHSQANEAHYHRKGFALTLGFKVRVFGTQIWLTGRQCLAGVKVKVLLNSAADGIQAKSA